MAVSVTLKYSQNTNSPLSLLLSPWRMWFALQTEINSVFWLTKTQLSRHLGIVRLFVHHSVLRQQAPFSNFIFTTGVYTTSPFTQIAILFSIFVTVSSVNLAVSVKLNGTVIPPLLRYLSNSETNKECP